MFWYGTCSYQVNHRQAQDHRGYLASDYLFLSESMLMTALFIFLFIFQQGESLMLKKFRLKNILAHGIFLFFILIYCGTGLAQEPTFISMTPDLFASVVGDPQTLTLMLSDTDGYENIQIVRMEIKDASGSNTDDDTIILEYYSEYNKVVMYNHDDGRYRGGPPGADLVIEDSLCSFDISQTTVEGNEDTLTINWNITPKVDFTGDKIVYLNVFDFDSNRLRVPVIASWSINLGETFTVDMSVLPVDGGSTFPAEGAHFYQENEMLTIAANANPGYRFVNWTGDVPDPFAPSTTITIDSDKTITANFEEVPTYILSIAAAPLEGGTTSPGNGDQLYSEDQVVVVTAIPETGYRFVSWTGDVTDPTAPSTTITMDMDKTITANFEEVPTYTLSIGAAPSGGGTTTPDIGGHLYTEGQVVFISAIPNTGFRFIGWTGDVSDPAAQSTAITINMDEIVTANFEAAEPTETFILDFDAGANVGDITYQRIGVELPFEITREDFIAAGFNATSEDLYNLSISHMHNLDKVPENPENWILLFDDGSGVAVPFATLLGDSALAFIEESFNTSFDLSGLNWKFIIDETSDDGPFDRDRLFLDKLTVTTVNFGEVSTYNLSIGAEPAEGGTTSPDMGDHLYNEGQLAYVIANPSTGYRFVSWTGGVADPYAASTTITMDMDKTITANFEAVPTYTLSIGAAPMEGGTTSPSVGDQLYSEDQVVSVTAIPDTGYAFVGWTGDVADPFAPSTTITMDMDKSITANFEAVPTYTLSIGAVPMEGGTTSPSVGDQLYTENQVVFVTAIPGVGYRFVNWTGDVTDPDTPSTTITMDMDKSITANFEEVEPTDNFTVDFDSGANVGDITYERIGVELPFEITRDAFIAAGFSTLLGDIFTVSISHMHNGDRSDNPENWILSFDDGNGVITPIGTLGHSALEFIEESFSETVDLSGLNWKFIISETSDDGPYDRDRLFLDKLTVTNVSIP
jgi:uncharacterized repeat protein (TIGR02543 family)